MKVTLPPFVVKILKKFESANFEIYIVGGAIRDLLMGKEVDDWDFTTSAKPEDVIKLFPDAFYDNKYGTVGISDDSSPNPYEITTFRKEKGYSDARRPDRVEWGKSLDDDLKRRDFTINALALKATSESENYEIIDLFGGKIDLKNKLVRAVGDANERFSEDALRLMRAVRIATELGFQIEEKTLHGIKANASLINKIAKERVSEELIKILASPNPYSGMTLLQETELMEQMLPEFAKTFGVEQKSPNRHHIYDVGTHSMLSLKEVAKRNTDPIVRFATLLHDIGKPSTFKRLESGTITFYNHEVVGARIVKQIAERLRFSKNQTEKLWRLVRFHQFVVTSEQTDSAIRRFIKNVGLENVNDMLDLRTGDRLGGGSSETSWRFEEFKKRIIEVQKQPFSLKDLKISGEDIMKKLKLKPGPKVGEILNRLFDEVVKKKIENKKEVLLEKSEKLIV